MIKVGVIGLGMMGLTHLDVYRTQKDVKVVALSDLIPDRLTGKARAAGNIEGQAASVFDYASAKQYDEGKKLIADKEIELVDICIPTPFHVEFAIAALQAGKHVLVEKPVGRHYADALRLADAAEKAKGLSMVALCMRFWPGWTWLKDAIDQKPYGKILAAQFRRMSQPNYGTFYPDGKQSGGAILDLHIHDTDFIQWCFGMPKAVTSVGYTYYTGEIDHVSTQYHYDHVPFVTAEGGWTMSTGHPFRMQYTANFERATAVFDLGAKDTLMLYEKDKQPRAVELDPNMGYTHEIVYFLNCIKTGKAPTTVTVRDATKAVKIVEAEEKSAKTKKTVVIE